MTLRHTISFSFFENKNYTILQNASKEIELSEK